MNQPKVAHITTVDVSLRYLLLEQMQSLKEAGYEVVAVSAAGPEVSAIEAVGIRHIAVPMTRNLTPFQDIVSLWRLYQVMKREHFVVVHTHTPKPGLLGQLAAKLARVPVVINTLHGSYFHPHMHPLSRRFYMLWESVAALCSDVILSQNQDDIQTYIEHGICSPARIKHLGNGLNLTLFNPDRIGAEQCCRRRHALGIPEQARIIGFVGRLAAKRKGFLDFLKAGEQVIRACPDVHFLIVGEADRGKPDAVEPSAARNYGIVDRCHFLGQRPNCELPELYALVDLLVLPSLFEGLPRVVMEAAAMRVPVVATDVKGNREAVEHGVSGLLVPLGDVPALAAAIVELLSDPSRRQRMGDAGHRIAHARFDEQKVFERVKTEYARLLDEKGVRTSQPLPKLKKGST